MTGGIRIFQIELPFGTLSAWRDFAGEYRLECTAPLGCGSLTIGEGLRLGRAGEIIERRFSFAGQRGDDVRTGPVFARREGTRDLIIETRRCRQRYDRPAFIQFVKDNAAW